MSVSFAIMAHPKRAKMAKAIQKKLDCEIFWDEINERWDTGRRALLGFDPNAKWHVVVQDDAILCRNFKAGVVKALEPVPEVPVSFYTGKTQPHASEVKMAVQRALDHNKHWFSMQGPLWGVAVAIPTAEIESLVGFCDRSGTPNYDMRMTEFFNDVGIDCWYSIPSLVNHRVGPDNPSLVPDRSSSDKRTAHAWIGKKDPRKISWDSGCLPWVGITKRKWAQFMDGYRCGNCTEKFERLSDVINHNFVFHSLGAIDFIATSPESEHVMGTVWKRLYPEARGTFWVVGKNGIKPLRAKRTLSRHPRRFTVADCYKAAKYAIGRTVWTMDNKAELHA